MIHISKPYIGGEEKRVVSEILDSGMIACGPKTEEFEKKFAKYVECKHAIAMTSGALDIVSS